MKKTGRRVLITLGVLAAVIIIAAVVLRLVFTQDRLMAIIIPRAEKALQAEIEVGSVGIEFPFGFGVEIEDLKFKRPLSEGKEVSFVSDRVEVKASISSLIRRRPRLSSVNIEGGIVVAAMGGGNSIELMGISSEMSVAPEENGYKAFVDIKADSLVMLSEGSPRGNGITELELKGMVKAALPFEKSSEEIFPESSFEGKISFSRLTGPALDLPLDAAFKGLISSKGRSVTSEDLVLSSRYYDAGLSFNLLFDENAAPRRVTFSESGETDMERLSGLIALEGAVVSGAVKLDIQAEGDIPPLAVLLKGLSEGKFSKNVNPIPEQFVLSGSVNLVNYSFERAEPPLSISDLDLKADLSGNDIENVEGMFNLDGSSVKMKGSMKRILPALFEMAAASRRGDFDNIGPEEFGGAFSLITVEPLVSLEISGDTFDAIKYFPTKKEAGEEGKSGAAAGMKEASRKAEAGIEILVSNPFTLIALKHSDMSIDMKEFKTPFGDLTSVKAEVESRNGIVRVYPVTAGFAGGKISSAASVDLTDLEQIGASANISAEGVRAAPILARLTESGNIFEGIFDLNGTGRVNIAPGIDPLKSLHARYSLTSKGGTVDFTRYLSSISAATGIDLSAYEKYKYDSWIGNFIVSGGKVIIDKWNMVSKEGNILASGAIGLDGSLACRAKLVINPETQERMKDLRKYRDLVELFKDDKGNLVFPFDIGGTAKAPKVSLDQSGAKKKAEEKLLEELKKKASDKLKGLFN